MFKTEFLNISVMHKKIGNSPHIRNYINKKLYENKMITSCIDKIKGTGSLIPCWREHWYLSEG